MMARKPSVQLARWLLFVWLATNPLCSASKKNNGVVCNATERQALLKFKLALKASFYSDNPLFSWVGDDCCRWIGVGCDSETGHVIKLDLSGAYTDISGSGKIDPSLLELKHLSHLDLSNNYFGHKLIPNFFGSFMKLRYLNLSYTHFAGTIPHQLGNISSLHYLDFKHDRYSLLKVDNLQWLSHLSSLEYLDMGSVNLSMVADWLQPINMIPSLSVLRLSSCGLRNFPTLPHLNFTSLTILDLSSNAITSKSLDWLSNLPNLESLDLSHNRLEAPFPSSLRGCNLLKLDFSWNNMTGEVNRFLESLTRCSASNLKKHESSVFMRELDLSYNNFSGTIPESLGQLTELVHLRMSHNSLEGTISEAHFANLTRLETLYMSENSFVFNVGHHWIPPFQLKYVGLRSCQIGPQFPTWLQFMRKDRLEIDFSQSQISGFMPDWFWNLSSQISYVDISQNLIYGKIPSSLNFVPWAKIDFSSNLFEGSLPQNVSDAYILDLSNNFFSGPIKMSIMSVQYLSLSNNSLSDSIPSSICSIRILSVLDLSKNNLTGQIPSCFNSWPFVLDLSYNNLNGVIPNSFGPNSFLIWLQLSHNNLSGLLPPSIRNQSRLLALDLSGNRLSGSIPRWVGESLSRLIILNLRSNMFNGTIPPQLSLISSLQILDLADNRLSGVIPSSFYNFTSMISRPERGSFSYIGLSIFNYNFTNYGRYVMVVMKGLELKYTNTLLPLLTTMDLSRNSLSGEIPQELTSLHGLQSLNLSGNHLEGKIPENIGDLQQLESLDLSQNHLSGTIPSSISALTFLSSLNLANNNLSGRIPSGSQLQTFNDPSIYAGNYDLCGLPLPKPCVGEAPHTFFGEDEQDGTEHLWFYVGVAPGFVVGFWVVCGILIFNKPWRIAYYRFFDRLNERLDGFYVKLVVKVVKKNEGLAT
ncbi:putative inactive leucine-rich repeat receptor-like protein kinase [Cinnamomum micranthum f. kanehirae]|uniref:Putative inactive leucine-rich repeat receptor-like protein kinase n=1 Tax=Cinnamomum micranthum f. kanehirae TaxID=337451 RepID=A0A3S3NPH3_9MAGN|nr:putative inactive leucine-rich repeat receptor-like protein kinase [Cinnamomum micranthum f. kanehirae]